MTYTFIMDQIKQLAAIRDRINAELTAPDNAHFAGGHRFNALERSTKAINSAIRDLAAETL